MAAVADEAARPWATPRGSRRRGTGAPLLLAAPTSSGYRAVGRRRGAVGRRLRERLLHRAHDDRRAGGGVGALPFRFAALFFFSTSAMAMPTWPSAARLRSPHRRRQAPLRVRLRVATRASSYRTCRRAPRRSRAASRATERTPPLSRPRDAAVDGTFGGEAALRRWREPVATLTLAATATASKRTISARVTMPGRRWAHARHGLRRRHHRTLLQLTGLVEPVADDTPQGQETAAATAAAAAAAAISSPSLRVLQPSSQQLPHGVAEGVAYQQLGSEAPLPHARPMAVLKAAPHPAHVHGGPRLRARRAQPGGHEAPTPRCAPSASPPSWRSVDVVAGDRPLTRPAHRRLLYHLGGARSPLPSPSARLTAGSPSTGARSTSHVQRRRSSILGVGSRSCSSASRSSAGLQRASDDEVHAGLGHAPHPSPSSDSRPWP